MNVAWPLVLGLLALALGYRAWGRRAAGWLGVDPARETPAVRLEDGVDFVPTRPTVLFGHHFASIAAAGPIVGPTLALGYGYLPTWLWILGGVVFFGAVHDLSALFLSVREDGRSLAEVTRRVLGTPAYVAFLVFSLVLCVLVSAAFLDLTAVALSSTYPIEALGLSPEQSVLRMVQKDGALHGVVGGVASTSVVVMTGAAPGLGYLLTRRRIHPGVGAGLALGIALLSVWIGLWAPLTLAPERWILIVACYTMVAGFVPVWLLVQPRDFTNVQFLYLGICAMAAGVLAAGAQGVVIDAPALNLDSTGAAQLGQLWPILFVTIACGSISGAHGLIASGTTAKQVASERHLLPVAYGGMLGEALLGLLVTLVLLAGLGASGYESLVWPTDAHGQPGKGNAPLAFAAAVGGLLDRGFGAPAVYGTVFGILLLEGFLVTTVDTIVRLSRYLLEELWQVAFRGRTPMALRSRSLNTALPLSLVLFLTFTGGYKLIWPVFGTANQLLAALSLVTAAAWLHLRRRRAWFVAVPAAFMLLTTFASLATLVPAHLRDAQWILLGTDLVLALAAVLAISSALSRLRSFERRVAPPGA